MKAYLPILLLSTGLSFPALAQMYVGPVVGGQLSWTRFDDPDLRNTYDANPVPGYMAGLSASLKVRKRFFLNAALVYSTKGRKLEGGEDPLFRNRTRYDFIEIPVIYAVDFIGQLGSGKTFKYFFGAGPNISYWMGGKGTLYNTDLHENASYSVEDMKYRVSFGELSGDEQVMAVSDPNRLQLGLNVATGLVLEPRPRERFVITLRYELGHSFLSRTGSGAFAPTVYEENLQARNKGLRLSVSWLTDLRLEDRKRGKSTSRVRGKR